VDGNEVVTARELLMRTASDGEHLAEATSRGLIVVTHNGNDFMTPCIAWCYWRQLWRLEEIPHAGVIAIPQRTLLPYARAAREIGNLVMREPRPWNQCWSFDLTAETWVRQV
jgi:hypothetical protein